MVAQESDIDENNSEKSQVEGISFGTDGWRATLDEFTEPRLRMVAQAVATYLDENDLQGPVAIGYDARDHSRGFAEELARVLAANGRDVTLSARDCPTPTLAWTVSRGEYVGGLVITASHNPPEYNGVKFVTADGAPAVPAVTEELESNLAPPTTIEEYGTITETELIDSYVDGVESLVEEQLGTLGLEGSRVVYDAMHGSGRGVTDRLLSRAGATVERLRSERDPTFGGVAPEPGPETASECIERVTADDADLGFVNDGDADRVGIVTPERGYLDPNLVLALVYDVLLERDSGDVVRTVSTSSLVDRIARNAGHTVHETPVGFKWVAQAMGEHDVLVGGEESGGYGVTEHLRNKDGIFVALLLAVADSEKPLDSRLDDIEATYGGICQGRRSVDCPEDLKGPTLNTLEGRLPDQVADSAVDDISTVDGFKILLADASWLLVRPSGTEPKLRVYAEAGTTERVSDLLDAGVELVREARDDARQ